MKTYSMKPVTCRTVKELRDALASLPNNAVPISPLPPFKGVQIIPQESGEILICELNEPTN